MVSATPIHILYMEDDSGLALLLKKRLERQGFMVDLASDGEQGLVMYDPEFHDIIAVDQNMPGLEGLEVIKRLAYFDPVPPIIMITGTGDQRVAVEAMKLGARDYVIKDVEGGYLDLMPSVIKQVVYQQQLIDEKRRAEETLRQSEERYRSLVELSPDGIAVYCDEAFLYANRAVTRLLGIEDASHLAGRSVQEIIHPDYYDLIWGKLQRVLQYGEHIDLLESKLNQFDGQTIDVEIMAAPITFEGKAAAQVIIRDVTERKRAEEARHETERLRIALEKERVLSDLKTRLMVTISHELRTPLSIAYTSTELLEKFFDRMLSAQRTGHLQKIQAQISKLTEMMEDISLLIHDTFERLVPVFEPIDLKNLCETVLQQQNASNENQQRVILRAADQLPVLMLDARRIRYILNNLLSNALKYSPQESTISVNLFQEDECIVLRVSDQGIGIPAEEQTHIFEPFYRALNVGVIRGTGLGLSIVKEIAEMHSGTIAVESEVGKGCQISIFLPLPNTLDLESAVEAY